MCDNCSDDGHDADFVPRPELKQLPPVMQGRVKALKNLQLSTIKAEAEYYREVRDLDVKYQAKYNEINLRRSQVIDGSYEPSGAELEWPSEDEEEEEEKDPETELAKKVEDLTLHPDFPVDAKGLPKFWLHTLKNANEESLMGLIEPHDEEVLAHLTDLTVSLTPDNTGFVLHFHFKENPFFTNKVLTKEYTWRDGPDPKTPLEYDGPEIISCKGCEIDWKEGKDITKMTVKVKNISFKKDASDPKSPEKSTIEESAVETDSFFDFFSPPDVKEEGDDDYKENMADLAVDFDVGYAIKEKVIPRAVLYFTREIFDDDDEFEDCDSDEEEEEGCNDGEAGDN